MKTICELFGIQYPIIQGGMAHISRYELVSAVSNAGGLGVLTSGGMTAEALREQIRETRKRTDKPFAVNLMLKDVHIPELIQVIIEEGVKIVTTGAGTPKAWMPQLKEAGIKVIAVIPSVKIAKKMAELGVDAVVAEGSESGGHIGETTTMALVPQVAQAVSIPVIAAGGIANGQGVVAAFALGAQAVQIGTLFLSASECPVPDAFKQAIVDADDTATAVTGRSIGAPVRSIKNAMVLKYLELEQQHASREELEQLTVGALEKAVNVGDVEQGSIMAGQIVGLIDSVKPVQEIIETLWTQAHAVIDGLKHL